VNTPGTSGTTAERETNTAIPSPFPDLLVHEITFPLFRQIYNPVIFPARRQISASNNGRKEGGEGDAGEISQPARPKISGRLGELFFRPVPCTYPWPGRGRPGHGGQF
jgi:hypothetical protein